MRLNRKLLCVFVSSMTLGALWGNEDLRSLASEMKTEAGRLLGSLDSIEKGRATSRFDDRERFAWDYWPGSHPGIGINALKGEARAAATELIGTGLSELGYSKFELIKELEVFNPWRTPDSYLMIFDDPSVDNLLGMAATESPSVLELHDSRGRDRPRHPNVFRFSAFVASEDSRWKGTVRKGAFIGLGIVSFI